MQKLYIGVDPDIEKNGVCLYYSKTNFELLNLKFFELFDKLYLLKDCENLDIEVVIESGWLNKSNWHKVSNGSAAINANIGLRTGANHEVGRKIVEMCQYLGLKHHLIKPTKSKVNAETFKAITKYQGRTNSEMRDSCLLVYGR
ncbi:MAG: hypothetical protein IPQ23_21980 [Cytophagaceae bacterium]|nr:hypothetical protein [Cytophagaceae bacterium]